MVSFLLECLRRGGRAQLRTEDCGCLGDWHRQWCSKIGGSCWRDSWLPSRGTAKLVVCTRRLPESMCSIRGSKLILRSVGGKVRGLNMRVAQVKKSLTRVHDMCAAGHRVVFDFDDNKRDPSHAVNKLTGERTHFKLRNRVWELEVTIIPKEAS